MYAEPLFQKPVASTPCVTKSFQEDVRKSWFEAHSPNLEVAPEEWLNVFRIPECRNKYNLHEATMGLRAFHTKNKAIGSGLRGMKVLVDDFD
ncbi:hypothetical protein FRC18_011991 [Serendipita sp. 400]|nr:hypothetical protein FRC18_011991 [Serendipita sp. 400]